jgi:hypothetical protein
MGNKPMIFTSTLEMNVRHARADKGVICVQIHWRSRYV